MLRSRVRVIVISGIALIAQATVWAQTTPPTADNVGVAASPQAMATSRPNPADPASPRGALESLVGAMQAGDATKIKSLIATTNPTEDKMVDAMANMSVSQKKFRTAAQTAYGDSAKELTGDTEAGTAAGLAKIDAAPEKIDGDTATVDPSGGDANTAPGQPTPPPLTLKNNNGHWEIPIGELARGVDQNTIQQRLDDLAFMSKMMDESADEVSKGMYKTPKDAGEAIKSKMMVAMMKRANAATQQSVQPPGTQPSATPPADAPPPTPAPAPSSPGM
jgi:hypothetical protein